MLLLLGLFVAGLFASRVHWPPNTTCHHGSDSNPGTSQPWAPCRRRPARQRLGHGLVSCEPTRSRHPVEQRHRVLEERTSDTNRIKYWPTRRGPVIDFTNMKVSSSGYTMGMHVTAATSLQGIEEKGVPMINDSNNGIAVDDPAAMTSLSC